MQITEEHISVAQVYAACSEALEWLREQPRTWRDLVERRPDWAVWAMVHYPDCPINLEGLDSHSRAMVMIDRTDCPVNLEGLSSRDRARVMIDRPDCPVNLDGLSSGDRTWVIRSRPDFKEREDIMSTKFEQLFITIIVAALLTLSFFLLAQADEGKLHYPRVKKQPAELVRVEDLGPKYDGKKVALFVWGRRGEVAEGIRGSKFLRWVVGDETGEVTVYSTTPVMHYNDSAFIITGHYYTSGRFGGYLAERYIILGHWQQNFGGVK